MGAHLTAMVCDNSLTCHLTQMNVIYQESRYSVHLPNRDGRFSSPSIITSAKEVMFLPVFVCLFVSKITQKVIDGSF